VFERYSAALDRGISIEVACAEGWAMTLEQAATITVG
jgi:hypothetical protein